MQNLDRFKSHPPLPAGDKWGEDFRDLNQTAPNPIVPGPYRKVTRSGKTIQPPGQRQRQLVINPNDNVDIIPSVLGDTRTAAQWEEDRRHEEVAMKKDRKTAWAAIHGSSAGESQGTNNPNDPLANVPKKSRFSTTLQIDAQGR